MFKRQSFFTLLILMIFVFSACSESQQWTKFDSPSPPSNPSEPPAEPSEPPAEPDQPPTDPDEPPADPDTPPADPDPTPPPFSTEDLMTAQDIENSASSNISITNATGVSVTGSGLYIASFDINDCSACFGAVVSGNNAGGAMVQPVPFSSGQSIQIGQNYLYNMIYNGIYYIKNTVGPSPCELPGCSWPSDSGVGAGWCLSIGVLSLDSTYTYSNYVNGANPPASVLPYSAAVTSIPFNYKYDLIDPSTLGVGNSCLGPVACDDETLTCVVSAPQSQSFQSY